MQHHTETTPALVLAPGEQLCSKDPTQKATHAYQWDWGECGVVCAEQAALLQQAAPQLGRSLTLYPLPPSGPVTPTRDERIAWYAKEKTLELELEDAKTRGLELWRNNESLRQENRLHVNRKAQADEEMKRLQLALNEAQATNRELESENADLLGELERAKTLAAFAPRGSELGIEEPPHVVDGDR